MYLRTLIYFFSAAGPDAPVAPSSASVFSQKSTPKKMFGDDMAASRTKFFVPHFSLSQRSGCFFPGKTFIS